MHLLLTRCKKKSSDATLLNSAFTDRTVNLCKNCHRRIIFHKKALN